MKNKIFILLALMLALPFTSMQAAEPKPSRNMRLWNTAENTAKILGGSFLLGAGVTAVTHTAFKKAEPSFPWMGIGLSALGIELIYSGWSGFKNKTAQETTPEITEQERQTEIANQTPPHQQPAKPNTTHASSRAKKHRHAHHTTRCKKKRHHEKLTDEDYANALLFILCPPLIFLAPFMK